MDLSARDELSYLSELVLDIRTSAPNGEWLLVGALARDILLFYGHEIEVSRTTEDVDLAVAVADWQQYAECRQRLLDNGMFRESDREGQHKLLHRSEVEVDLVPFGGVADEEGTIAWPPDNWPEMSVLGFEEALASSSRVQLPGSQVVDIVCLPAFVMLKIIAWSERYARRPGVDAQDLFLVLSNYVDCGNRERLFHEHEDLLNKSDFDYELAGPIMAGRDLRRLLEEHGGDPQRSISRITDILQPELNTEHPGRLVRQAPDGKIERMQELLGRLLEGLAR